MVVCRYKKLEHRLAFVISHNNIPMFKCVNKMTQEPTRFHTKWRVSMKEIATDALSVVGRELGCPLHSILTTKRARHVPQHEFFDWHSIHGFVIEFRITPMTCAVALSKS